MVMTGPREIEEKDLLPLAEVLPGGFRGTNSGTWLRRFENWWTLNPAFTSECPRGWVLEEKGKIVGFIGNVPVQFDVDGEPGIAAAAVSWYVDPSVRGLASLGLFNEYLDQDDAALFLFYTEDANLSSVLRRYGFKQYPSLSRPWEYRVVVDRVRFIRGNISSLLHRPPIQGYDLHAGESVSGPVATDGLSPRWQVPSRSTRYNGEVPGSEYTCSLCSDRTISRCPAICAP
jgi:hypothetical protein